MRYPEDWPTPRFTMADWLASSKKLQIEAYGGDPATLDPEARLAWTRNMVLGLIVEATEVLDEMKNWRWWAGADGQGETVMEDRDAYIEELVDVVHFAGALAIAVRCTDEEWAEAYARKSAINRSRQGVA